uniref:Uncharacterized protein n=1 Tax=Dunaliella tertiolecta TaxID=3047 RepID=A0A7S3QNX3_DUNTE
MRLLDGTSSLEVRGRVLGTLLQPRFLSNGSRFHEWLWSPRKHGRQGGGDTDGNHVHPGSQDKQQETLFRGPTSTSSSSSSASSSQPAPNPANNRGRAHAAALQPSFNTGPVSFPPYPSTLSTYSPSSHRPQQGLHVPPSALGSSLYQHVAQPPQQLHTRPSPPRVRLVPYSNQRPEQPVAGSTNISLILEVFNVYRKFGQTHHRLFFLLAERLSYNDLLCQSPARIAGLAEAAHALEALEMGMLTLLRRVAWRRRHDFAFEHLNTVLWAISKVKVGSPEAMAELDVLAHHWSRGALHWLDGLRPLPIRQASQSHTQPQWRDCRSQVTASTSADAGTAAPGVAQEGEAGAAAIALGPAGGDTKGTYTSAPEPSPGSKPAARGAHGAVASQGQHEWEGLQLVRILETVASLAAVQYRPQGTSPQPKALVGSGAPGSKASATGVSGISYPMTKAMTREDEEILFRGPFQRPIPIQSSNGLCLEELRLLYFHDIKKQETLDNMQKILVKSRRHILPRIDALAGGSSRSLMAKLERIFLLHSAAGTRQH